MADRALKDYAERAYDTPDGYINAIRQLSRQGYNYFLPIKKTKRRSVLVYGRVPMPKSQATLH